MAEPKPTIWTAAASNSVPILDALDMSAPPIGTEEARERAKRAKERAEKILRPFAKTRSRCRCCGRPR